MKSYWMAAAAIFLAAPWVGAGPKAWTMQQPVIQTDAGPGNPGQSTGTKKDSAAASPAVNSATAGKGVFFILAEFTQSLNAKKLKPGDQVKAEVTQDVLSHGKIVIPVESKLVGHVTEVKSHSADDPESRLGIVFDKVLLKHRVAVGLHGVLQALSAPAMRRSRVDEPDPMLSPGSMGLIRPSGSMSGRANSTPVDNMGSSANPALNPAGSPPPFSNGAAVGQVPTAAASRDAGAALSHNASPRAIGGEQKPMSVGMPLGVFGLKGLTLTAEATANTPGPVILSKMDNVKLESGTQVLLKVTDAAVMQK